MRGIDPLASEQVSVFLDRPTPSGAVREELRTIEPDGGTSVVEDSVPVKPQWLGDRDEQERERNQISVQQGERTDRDRGFRIAQPPAE